MIGFSSILFSAKLLSDNFNSEIFANFVGQFVDLVTFFEQNFNDMLQSKSLLWNIEKYYTIAVYSDMQGHP